MEAHILFNKLLADNNLTAQLVKPRVRALEDGAVLIEQPQLLVTYTIPPTPPQVQPHEETKGDENAGQSSTETTN